MFLTNARTPVNSFIDNLVDGKENLILQVTQIFKEELELRNLLLFEIYPHLPPRFDGNPAPPIWNL